MAPNITALQIATRAEATCYSLPYGGIGFASHIITYYTMVMLVLGRQPLPPFRPLKHQLWSSVLGVAQLITTIVLSAIAIHRCRNQWAFVLLGVWMLTTSICLSTLTISAPSVFSGAVKRNDGVSTVRQWRLKPNNQPESRAAMMHYSRTPHTDRSYPNAYTDRTPPRDLGKFLETAKGKICVGITILWLCGCIVGVVAICTITVPQYRSSGPLYIVTSVFGGLVFLGPMLILVKCLYCPCCLNGLSNRLLLAFFPVCICVWALLWMDWVLGVATGNLVGVPAESAEALYWTYIVVKRLGLFSM